MQISESLCPNILCLRQSILIRILPTQSFRKDCVVSFPRFETKSLQLIIRNSENINHRCIPLVIMLGCHIAIIVNIFRLPKVLYMLTNIFDLLLIITNIVVTGGQTQCWVSREEAGWLPGRKFALSR